MIKDYQRFDLCGRKTFEKAIFQPPFRMVAEMPNDACFYYVTRGRSSVYAPDTSFKNMSEEGVVLRCGTYLNEFLCDSDLEYCEAIAIHFYPDVLEMIYDQDLPDLLSNLNEMDPAPYERVKGTKLVKNYIDSLQFYFNNPELVSDELLALKMKELILLLAKTDNVVQIKALLGSLFSKTEFDFKQVIAANLYNNLSLVELAALTNLSLSSFKRKFKAHFESSPARYMKTKKLKRAAKLLKGTKDRVSNIAFDSGFSDLAQFSKAFSKHYGCTPSNFRLGLN